MPPLTVGFIIKRALGMGLKAAPTLIVAVILWELTIGIPYLNVGTTIGLVGLCARMGRGDAMSPTQIFSAEHRKSMGDFFLVGAFLLTGMVAGALFLILPAIILGLAWSLAPLLVVDEHLNPLAALSRSNELTYGKKCTMFFGYLLVVLTIAVPTALLCAAAMYLRSFLMFQLFCAAGGMLLLMSLVATQATIYAALTPSRPAA